MASFKEIVTKAVIGKGKKYFKNDYTITPETKPNTVLGCWVINHNFKGYKSNDKIGVDGSYDVNIWYSYDNDSKTSVINKNVSYNDLFNLKLKDNAEISSENDIIVRSLKQPNCVKANILENGDISFEIEKELGIEVVGDTKVKISIEEDEEPWDEIEDELNEEEIDKSVNEDYLENTE